jgi:hypothetical protein
MMNYTVHDRIDLPQPHPLILDTNSEFVLQPIVENIDLPNYSVIFTLKLYYIDRLEKPITFKNGDPLETYCSDSTITTFYFVGGDSLALGSLKRMSCKIMALFNLSHSQNIMLRDNELDSIKIHNYVTDNKYTFPIQQKRYLRSLISKHDHWR